MSLLQTLIRPDLEEHPERAEVARAADLLQVGEFQLLQLAHSDWFGRDLTADEADRLFASYMLHDRVPSWARHFARRVLALDAAGTLDDRDPAWHRFDADYRTHEPHGLRGFCAAATVIVVVIGGGLWLGFEDHGASRQVLPPFFSDKELGIPAPRP